ncbi:MAG: type II toxin-antitoxin system RelE/ParE family toxin [Bacteroidetes bacterium]|nr:type II toxin-antitoxin system RelE/ParE family toxin [Bacteroidota bacterium]
MAREKDNFLLLSDDAEHDIDEAFLWYEFQSAGLGKKFIRALESGFITIDLQPNAFPFALRNIRKFVIKKFPFNVYYRINETGQIEIIRVLHHKRKPKLK